MSELPIANGRLPFVHRADPELLDSLHGVQSAVLHNNALVAETRRDVRKVLRLERGYQ